jgi:hypothetical protein
MPASPSDRGVQDIYEPLPHYSNINITEDFMSAGGFATPGPINTTTYQLSDAFSSIKGPHQMQFGVSYIRPVQATVLGPAFASSRNGVNQRPAFGRHTEYVGGLMFRLRR